MKPTRHAFVLTLLLATPALAGSASQPSTVRKPAVISGTVEQRAGVAVAGPSGAVWQLPGGPVVRAEAGTSVRVLHTPQPLRLGPGAAVAGYTVVLRSGSLGIEVPSGSRSAIVLVAPRQIGVIVKSGRVAAVAGPEGTTIANQGGETSTSVANGAYVPLAPGKLLELSSSGRAVRDLSPAPTEMRGQRVLIATQDTAKLAGLSWDPVSGASSYRVDVLAAGETTPLARTETRTAALDTALAELRPGDYVVRVQSREPSGILSAGALEQPVRVLGCELPGGAYVDERGTLRLGRGQRAKFVGVEGLEMTYSAGGTFARAWGTAGLFRNEPTTAYFRFPQSYELSMVRMAPRDIHARIELGPRTASWPKDTLLIRIRAESTNGEPVPAWLEVTPRVMLGVKRLDVSFTRKGAWLEARLPPPKGAGPWVVRVEVSDQFGNPLGRESLEVIRTPKPRRTAPPAASERLSQR